jgi:hypothetical protein
MCYLRLWVEWDYGQDSYIFTDEDKAKEWLWKQIQDNGDFASEFPDGVEMLFEEGLAGFQTVTILA